MFLGTALRQWKEIKELRKESKFLYEKNKQQKKQIEQLDEQRKYAHILAKGTLDSLETLLEIDRQDIDEETKRRQRKTVINYLQFRNADIIKRTSRRQNILVQKTHK